MTILVSTLLAAAAAATAAAPAAAPIVVTATRTPAPLATIGASVSLVDRATLDRRQAATALDALATVPGVSFARNGGPGGVGSVFLRGADSDQTLVLIDGVRANDPASPGGGFDFGTQLLVGVDRIEVVKGAQSVVWGSQAIGGVVNFISPDPEGPLALAATAEAGHRGTVQLTARASGAAGPLGFSLGAGWLRTDGISAFAESRGGRETDDFESLAATGRVVLALSPALALDARASFADSKAGIDGFPPPNFAFADTPERSNQLRATWRLGGTATLADGRVRARLGWGDAVTDRQTRARRGAAPASFDSLGRLVRLDGQVEADLGEALSLVAGAEREVSRYRTASFGGPASRARAAIDSLYAQLRLQPLAGLTLTGGARHDDHSRFGARATFAAAAAFTPNDGDTLLRASWGQGFKAPSLFQLFSDFGNPALRPETADSLDAGISQRLADGRADVSATFFRRLTRDQIDFVSCFGNPSPICIGRQFGTYDNVRRSRTSGLELALSLRPTDRLTLSVGYTFLDAVNRDNGRKLARRPQDTLTAGLDWETPFGLSVGAEAQLVGARFDNASNTRRLPGHTLVGLRARLPVSDSIELTARIDNLFDETYETVFQYGQPGRAAFLGARLKL